VHLVGFLFIIVIADARNHEPETHDRDMMEMMKIVTRKRPIVTLLRTLLLVLLFVLLLLLLLYLL
jgi:hypothetical protein